MKGGMVMPYYWADIWAAATADILKQLEDVGKVNGSSKGMSTIALAAGAVCAVIGLVLIALCKGKPAVAAA